MSTPSPHWESVSNPHDAYVKTVFRELPQARGLFRAYLPDDVRGLFDWRTLRLETESFLSDELQRDFADLRFSIRLVGDAVERRLTLLFEHKYLGSVMQQEQEGEVRQQALQSIQDEYLPVKEHIMTLLEHWQKQGEKRGEHLGKVATLLRLMSAAFAEFSPADAVRVRKLPEAALDELTDAIALRRTWEEIAELIQGRDGFGWSALRSRDPGTLSCRTDISGHSFKRSKILGLRCVARRFRSRPNRLVC